MSRKLEHPGHGKGNAEETEILGIEQPCERDSDAKIDQKTQQLCRERHHRAARRAGADRGQWLDQRWCGTHGGMDDGGSNSR